MQSRMIPPLRLQPIIKQRPWGGRRLAQLWCESRRDNAAANGWAESWEVVTLGDDQSRIIGGEFAGRSLGDLIRERGSELLGERTDFDQFPLLFKFLDAAERLSVQVHPNDGQALRLTGGRHGKSEAWVIIAAEPDSQLSVGLKPGVERKVLEQHLAAGTVAECLNTFPAKVGDVISVPAGTVHAIGGGVALAEIQQTSDVTFRLFDWNRLDANGRPRDLHIAEAMPCIDFTREPEKPQTPRVLDPQQFSVTQQHAVGSSRHEELIHNEHFLWRRHQADRTLFALAECGRCRIVSIIAGSAEIVSPMSRESLSAGDTLVVPASCGVVQVTPTPSCLLLEALPE